MILATAPATPLPETTTTTRSVSLPNTIASVPVHQKSGNHPCAISHIASPSILRFDICHDATSSRQIPVHLKRYTTNSEISSSSKVSHTGQDVFATVATIVASNCDLPSHRRSRVPVSDVIGAALSTRGSLQLQSEHLAVFNRRRGDCRRSSGNLKAYRVMGRDFGSFGMEDCSISSLLVWGL